jgi:hypothetical protein
MNWVCPKCERTLRMANQWHNCVKIDIDSLFKERKEELIFIFDRLLLDIADWKNVNISATQNCIVFTNKLTFLIVRPMKNQIDLKFYSEDKCDEDPVIKSVPYSGKYENHIRLSMLEEVNTRVIELIKSSYKLLS